MQTTSALWKSYQALPSKQYEYKVVIGTDEYLNEDLFSMSSELQLCDDSVFALGNVFSRKLNLAVKQKVTPIAKMSNVDLYIRMNGDSGPTEWLPQGKFYIDTRKKSGLATVLECYDKVLMMESSFVIEGESLSYPMAMSDAVSTVCTRLDITFLNPAAIQSGFNIEYPNDHTMREVLGYIADANGGNFILNDSGELQLVLPANGTSVATGSYVNLYDDNDEQAFDKVIMYYNDSDGFESGTGTNEFVDSNIWATQAIADHVLSVLTGYTHKPYTGTRVYVDPAIELGDTLTLNSVDYVLFNSVITYGGNVVMDMGAPGETELNHEYPYVGSYAKSIKNKVTLGAAYYGTTIDRETGLQIIKSDNYARAIFNADMLALQTGDGTGNSWVNQVYFDPVSGKYIFNGTLSANVVEALGSVLAPYLYASKANIAELTVDQMNTGDKVAKYLNSNTDDVNYIKIDDQYMEWITASTDGASTEQVKDRDGNDLYWTDDTHITVTTDATSYPVTIYVYTEAVKAAFNFELDDDGVTYVPKIVMGAGDGVTAKSGKGYIYKNTEGLILEYFSQNDEKKRQIRLTDDGIGFTPKFFNICSVSNSGAVAASAETVLDGLEIDFIDDTKIAYTVRMTVDPDTALDLTVKVRVGGTVIHTAPYDFSAGEDTIVMTGCIEGVTAGEGQTIDVTITPSTSTANIAVGEYQLSLIVSDIVTEAEPVPVGALKTYLSGGSNVSYYSDFDEYDLDSNSWTSKTSMLQAVRAHAATSVSGKGYVFDGYRSATQSNCDEYDPAGNSWTNKTAQGTARSDCNASTVDNIAYEHGTQEITTECNAYSPLSDNWTSKANVTYGLKAPASTSISDKLYSICGYRYGSKNYCLEYSPAGNAWASKAGALLSSYDMGASELSNKGYIYGGITFGTRNNCDEYDPVGNSWASKTNATYEMEQCAAATGSNLGIACDIRNTNRCQAYDASSDSWSTKSNYLSPSPRLNAKMLGI